MPATHITNARILASALRQEITDGTDEELARTVLDGLSLRSSVKLDTRFMTRAELADMLDRFTDEVERLEDRQAAIDEQVRCN